jgi:uncharacterized protein YkwD
VLRLALAAVAFAVCLSARADAELVDALNAARARGCGGKPGLERPFAAEPRLASAAQLLAQSVQAGDALQRSDYRATKWALVSVSGASGSGAVAEQVVKGSCGHLLDAGLSELGVYRRVNQVWIVFAAPFAPPAAADAAIVSERVLVLVNAARAQARECGSERLPAAGPLRLSATLNRAALAHSGDMAAKGFFSHDGSDGSSVMVRASRVGYAGRAVGENIASGQTTPEAAVEGWIKSPPHCANLMSGAFTEMGVAYVVNPSSPMGIYWTQVFGKPR